VQLALRSSCDRDLRETWSQHPARRRKALWVWLTILNDLLEIGCNLFIRTITNHGGQLNGTMQLTEERLQAGWIAIVSPRSERTSRMLCAGARSKRSKDAWRLEAPTGNGDGLNGGSSWNSPTMALDGLVFFFRRVVARGREP
jgi:hypothetical protein